MAELSPAAAILVAFRERYKETLRPGPFVGRWQAKCLAEALEALADVAEGERRREEGDLLQWAERRCAKALANIRPVMKQHQIRTSEWPPLPAPQGGKVEA